MVPHRHIFPLLLIVLVQARCFPQLGAMELTWAETEWLDEHPVVRVSNETDWPPYDFLRGDVPSGISVEYTELVFSELGIEIEWVNGYTWNELLEMAAARELDVMQSVARLPEREEYLIYARDPYLHNPRGIFTRPEHRDVQGLGDLGGLRIAVIEGFSTHDYLTDRFPEYDIVIVANALEGLGAVAYRDADAYVDRLHVVNYYLSKYNLQGVTYASMTGESELDDLAQYLAVRDDWPILAGLIDKAMEQISDAELQAIIDKWIPPTSMTFSQPPPLDFTREQESWLEENPVLSVVPGLNATPYGFFDAEGSFKGIVADYAALVGNRLGMTVETTDSMESGTVMGAYLPGYPEDGDLQATPGYFELSNVLLGHSGSHPSTDLNLLEGMSVMVVKGMPHGGELRREFPGINVVEVADTRTGISKLVLREYDYLYSFLPNIAYEVGRSGVDSLRLLGVVGEPGELTMAVDSDSPMLAELIRQALNSVTDFEHRQIEERWFDGYFNRTAERLNLDDDEITWMKQHSEISVACVTDRSPYGYLDETGKLSGVITDILQRIDNDLPLNFSVVQGLSHRTPFEDIGAQTADVVITVTGLDDFPTGRLMTRPLLILPVMVFTRNDSGLAGFSSLSTADIAVIEGSNAEEFLLRDFPDANIQRYPNLEEMISAVYRGQADAYLEVLAVSEHALRQHGIDDIRVSATTPYFNEVRMAVRPDWPELVDLLNKSFSRFSDEEKTLLLEKWMAFRVERKVNWRIVILSTVLVAAVSFVIIYNTMRHNRRLATEIQERKIIERQLNEARRRSDEANRTRGEFLANMSHEIRTPINTVIGMGFLLLKTKLTPKQFDYVSKTDLAAKSLLRIINDILDLSKIDAGKLDIDTVDFDLFTVMDNIANLQTEKAKEKDLELVFDIPSSIPTKLTGDPLRLGQVLTNLVSNAIKFSSNGDVTIQVKLLESSPSNADFRFLVHDTGIGLSPEQQNQLFTPYTQTEEGKNRRHSGTGLGLSICKRLVNLMGGTIGVESRLGEGSTFSFTSRFGVVKTESRLEVPAGISGCRVLVVDDNDTARTVIADYLIDVGLHVSSCTSGDDALLELKQSNSDVDNAFHIVFIDWRMKGLNGLETARKIKQLGEEYHIPKVVIVTAYGREEKLRQSAVESERPDEVLLKPVSQERLHHTIIRLLEDDETFSGSSVPKAFLDDFNQIFGKTVLLVEDNLMSQQVTVDILGTHGVKVDTADNGIEALDILKDHRYDAVLMDLHMPMMNGYEVCKSIRDMDELRQMPIIAMTADAMEGVRDLVLSFGMNDYLSKPIDPKRLVSTLIKHIGNSKVPSAQVQMISEPVVPIHEALCVLNEPRTIDIPAGLAGCGGNEKAFVDKILSFQEVYTDIVGRMKSSLAIPDMEKLANNASALLADAGEIGATTLRDLLQSLSMELTYDHTSVRRIENLIFKIEIAMISVFDKIEVITQTDLESGAEEFQELSRDEELKEDLLTLETLIEDYNTGARAKWNELTERHASLARNAQFQELGKKLGKYDFDQSMDLLRYFIERINV